MAKVELRALSHTGAVYKLESSAGTILTPEAFERLPGCAFMPGAAYLRSIAA
jgi:hypothetical protein